MINVQIRVLGGREGRWNEEFQTNNYKLLGQSTEIDLR